MNNIIIPISNHPENPNIKRLAVCFGFENYHYKLKRVSLIIDIYHFLGDIQVQGNKQLFEIEDIDSEILNSKPIDKLNKRVRLVADMTSFVYADTGELITDFENIDPNRPKLEEYAFYWMAFEASQVNPNFIINAIQSADTRLRFNKPAGSEGVVLL